MDNEEDQDSIFGKYIAGELQTNKRSTNQTEIEDVHHQQDWQGTIGYVERNERILRIRNLT